MLLRPLSFLALVAGLFGCGGTTPPPEHAAAPRPAAAVPLEQVFAASDTEYVFTDPDRRKKLASGFPDLDKLAEASLREEDLPGLVLGVVIDGELAYAKGFGFTDIERKTKPDADTVYRVGSLTKSFTALAVLSLRDEGVLSLDDSIARYIPQAAKLVYPTRDTPPITLRQVLTHTSGLPWDGAVDHARTDRGFSEQQIVDSLPSTMLEDAPGTSHGYSNLGYGLLGIIAGRVAHTSLHEIIGSRILKPLGMTSTFWAAADVPAGRMATPYRRGRTSGVAFEVAPDWRFGAEDGAGGLHTTLHDIGRYIAFELAAYPPRNSPEAGPIRRSSIREAHFNVVKARPLRVQMKDAPEKGEPIVSAGASSYGYAWVVSEDCDFDKIVWHSGASGGFSAAIAMLPEQGVGVVLLRNFQEHRAPQPTPTVFKALLALKKTGGLSKRIPRPKLAPAYASVMPRLLDVYNAWNETTYRALLSPRRMFVALEYEQQELAALKRLHGACTKIEPTEILAPVFARFAVQCERGALELSAEVDSVDGLLRNFWTKSRGLPAPPALARAADSLAGLIGKWDDSVYQRQLALKTKQTPAEIAAFFQRLRDAHGSCKVKSFERSADVQGLSNGALHRSDEQVFALTCDRGGDLRVTLELDDKNEDAITTYAIAASGGGTCPVK